MIYEKLEHIRGDFGKRIAPFVIFSCLLHLALAVSVFSPAPLERLEEEIPRKPILVDFREHKDGESPEPGSLSPDPPGQESTARDARPTTPPQTSPNEPSAEAKSGKTAKARLGKAEREAPPKPKLEKPVERPKVVEKIVEASPRKLPSAQDLVPSVSDLMRWHSRDGKLFRSHIEQDGLRDRAAQVQYNAYLSILKQRVKERWDVSTVRDFRESTTIVWFTVGKDGSLQYLELVRSSGRTLLDEKAMIAIRSSFPMPAPPESLLDENGMINIEFSFSYVLVHPYPRSPYRGQKRIVD